MAIERGFSLYQVYPYFARKVEGGRVGGGRLFDIMALGVGA